MNEDIYRLFADGWALPTSTTPRMPTPQTVNPEPAQTTATLGQHLQRRFNAATGLRSDSALHAHLSRCAIGRRTFSMPLSCQDPARTPIPEEDLIVLEKIYHGRYGAKARKKQGALRRYIRMFRTEPLPRLQNLLRAGRRNIQL